MSVYDRLAGRETEEAKIELNCIVSTGVRMRKIPDIDLPFANQIWDATGRFHFYIALYHDGSFYMKIRYACSYAHNLSSREIKA